jgi:hypothetical protein
MKKMLKGVAFAAMLALSLFATTSDAFAKDARHGRETAWTDLGALPAPLDGSGNILEPLGVTWEE